VGLEIRTERLRLRPLTTADVDTLETILGDPETMRWYPAPYDRAGVERWIERSLEAYAASGFGLCAIEELGTGELLGDAGPNHQSVDGVVHVELGWHVRRDRWGEGIATEAGAAWRDWCWSNTDVDHLISLIRPENRQSWRVAEKLGMTVWRETVHAGLPHRVYRVDRRPTLS
jgi:RimJ/RimL family protein N-acetyltransferase